MLWDQHYCSRGSLTVALPRSMADLTLVLKLFANGQARVRELSLAIGYESEAAFSRAYATFYDRTPRELKPTRTAP